jgi:hypothetical protein
MQHIEIRKLLCALTCIFWCFCLQTAKRGMDPNSAFVNGVVKLLSLWLACCPSQLIFVQSRSLFEWCNYKFWMLLKNVWLKMARPLESWGVFGSLTILGGSTCLPCVRFRAQMDQQKHQAILIRTFALLIRTFALYAWKSLLRWACNLLLWRCAGCIKINLACS